MKAILLPSGAHLGVLPNEVSCTAFDPSLLQVQISGCPDISEL
jgi:hypothetical protein